MAKYLVYLTRAHVEVEVSDSEPIDSHAELAKVEAIKKLAKMDLDYEKVEPDALKVADKGTGYFIK